MGAIFRADVAHAVVVGEIVFAVGELQATLQQIGSVVVGIAESGRDPQSKKIIGVKICVVEGIDIGAQGLTQRSGQFALIADCGNRVQMRAKRADAFRFNGGFIHIRVIKCGDFVRR